MKTKSPTESNRLFAPLVGGFVIGVLAVGTVALTWNHDRKPQTYTLAA